MLENLNGNTRLFMTVGYPISQVKSPADITRAFNQRGVDAVQIPVEVPPDGIDDFFKGIEGVSNLDGIVATVPFKFAGAKICKSQTPRSARLGAANIIRRNPDGSWHGDMTDGLGFCNAVRQAGTIIKGRRALLIGAGGAGSAIGLALLDEGASKLAIYDIDTKRSETLLNLLKNDYSGVSIASDPSATNFDIIAHATPTGMKSDDPLPLDVTHLTNQMHVGDVITEPAVPPLIEEARARGCQTTTGIEMFGGHRELVVDFLLHADGS